MKSSTLTSVCLAATLAIAGVAVGAQTITGDTEAAKIQLANQLGVNPDDYSHAELADLNCQLMGADTEAEKARLLAGFKTGDVAPSAGANTEQLAASLGVDPDRYTLEQLVYIKGLVEGRGCSTERAAELAALGEKIAPQAASAKEQLAMVLGLDPTKYTLEELVAIKFD